MISAPPDPRPAAELSLSNQEELRLLLEQLGDPRGFSVSVVWTPDEATAQVVVEALRSRLPIPPKVIEARTWPKGRPFLRWLLDAAQSDCEAGRVCIVAGLGGVEITRHPLRHLNTNRNHWMRAAPCHWVLMLPTYAQLRATAEAAGLPRFALGEEMPDVYSIRSGDYVFEAESIRSQVTEIPLDLDPDRSTRRVTRDEIDRALDFLREFDPQPGPDAAALYARTLLNELEPLIEYLDQAARRAARELAERSRMEVSDSLAGRVLALRAALASQDNDQADAERLAKAALDRFEAVLAPAAVNANTLSDVVEGFRTLWRMESPVRDGRWPALIGVAANAGERNLGPDHPSLAKLLSGLGFVLMSEGKLMEAENLFRRSLVIRERALGTDHSDVARSLNGLALVSALQGKYVEAELFDRRSLAIRELAFGPEHPTVAKTLYNLGVTLARQGKYAEAEACFRRALTIRERALGPDHPDVQRSLNQLAQTLELQGRGTEASPLYHRATTIAEAAMGPDHPDT